MIGEPILANGIVDVPGLLAFVLDARGRVVRANHTFTDLAALPAGSLPDKDLLDRMLPPEQRHKALGEIDGENARSRERRFDLEILSPDGRRRVFACHAAAEPKSQSTGARVIVTGIDITERVRLEAALRKSTAQVRAIVETAVDAIITMDESGTIELFNPAAERIFGWTAGEALGRKIEILMPESARREHQRYVDNYLRTGQARIIGIGREVVGKRKDGDTFPMYLAVGEQKIEGRRYFTGIIRDLSERKRMEAQVLAISEREQQRIGQDLHDGLGQLLTGAALLAKALAGRIQQAAPALLPEIERVTSLLNEGIAQSRELARGLQPIGDCAELPTALRELGFRTEKLFSIACPVRADALPAGTSLSTAIHLYRIAQEAVHNAVRHGCAKHIKICLRTQDHGLQLAVRDNGAGFSQERSRGMGLHIMDYRARVIGAKLHVHSARGRGATVLCSLGRPENSAEASADEQG